MLALSSWMSWASSSAKCWFPVWKTILGQTQSLINVGQAGQVDHGTLEQLWLNLQVLVLIEDERLHKQLCFDLVLDFVVDDDFVDKAEEAL